MGSNLSAVVVTFHPELSRLKALLEALRDQVENVFVIDNGGSWQGQALFGDDDSGFVSLHSMGRNSGIAAAQNVGIQLALKKESEGVVFFDQDSRVPPGFVGLLANNLDSAKVIAPVFFDEDKGFGYPLVDIAPNGRRKKFYPDQLKATIDISVAISSGTLVHKSVFDRVGLMDEKLFIDYVDTEWCLRCAKEGISVRIEPRARMFHSIGEKSRRILGFRVPIHSPVRRYYRTRNALLLFRYSHIPRLMVVREVFSGFVHQMLIVASEPGKLAYLQMYYKAIRDGLKGVGGPCPVDSGSQT